MKKFTQITISYEGGKGKRIIPISPSTSVVAIHGGCVWDVKSQVTIRPFEGEDIILKQGTRILAEISPGSARKINIRKED